MKNAIKNSLKFNSKKGMSLLELIVAIIIIMVVVGASVSGLSLSYKSVLLGAAQDDAQSVAQRDCAIIMNAIQMYAEDGVLDSMMFSNPSTGYCTFNATGTSKLNADVSMELGSAADLDGDGNPDSGYNSSQYYNLFPCGGDDAFVKSKADSDFASTDSAKQNKKFRYYSISRTTQKSTDNTATEVGYYVYHVKTYVYYNEKSCSVCEGDVIVKQ